MKPGSSAPPSDASSSMALFILSTTGQALQYLWSQNGTVYPAPRPEAAMFPLLHAHADVFDSHVPHSSLKDDSINMCGWGRGRPGSASPQTDPHRPLHLPAIPTASGAFPGLIVLVQNIPLCPWALVGILCPKYFTQSPGVFPRATGHTSYRFLSQPSHLFPI